MVVSERNHSVPSVLIDGLLEILQSRAEQSRAEQSSFLEGRRGFVNHMFVVHSVRGCISRGHSVDNTEYLASIKSNSSVNEEENELGKSSRISENSADGGK